jgi:hypothetical protein
MDFYIKIRANFWTMGSFPRDIEHIFGKKLTHVREHIRVFTCSFFYKGSIFYIFKKKFKKITNSHP